MIKKILASFLVAMSMPIGAWAQFGVVEPLHVDGNQLKDPTGHKVVLHGVMDTPNPYFNHNRWGYACNDGTVSACINYFDKMFAAITDTRQGAYCNIFRLHLDPCWTNEGQANGEADISKFSAARLQKYLNSLYFPIAQKALNHGLYVVVRPPGVCPKELRVGDAYQNYLKTVWNIVSSNSNIKSHAGVISIELANEPVHITNQWGQNSASALHDYFQPIVDLIRKNGFTGVIWVPGTGYQSQYQDYKTNPIVGSNIGYAVHVYPGWYGQKATNATSWGFIQNFQNQVPVVTTNPILVSEIDWSPEKPGTGKYNEFGEWVGSNQGTWGTATTSKWGNAWKACMDHFGNISMTLTSADDYVDLDTYLKSGRVTPSFGGNPEACAKACFDWYAEYAKVNYAHKGGSGSQGEQGGGQVQPQPSQPTNYGTNLIPAWNANQADFIPEGWTVCDDGEEVAPGNVARGPRIMKWPGGGDFNSAFYCREVSADKGGFIEYGGKNGYRLNLGYGEYEVVCNAAAWQGTPYLKVEVFDPTDAVLTSTIIAVRPDVNKNTGMRVTNSAQLRLSFYSMIKGNYRIRFTPVADAQGNGGIWEEVVLGNIGLYAKGNPLSFTTANEVPAGWTIVDAGTTLTAGASGAGPRVFQFKAGGDLATGLYIRQSDASKAGYAEFGSANGYGMSLKAGQYALTYNAVAWAGNPYMKCEVINSNDQVVGSQIIALTKSVEKDLNASTSGSAYGSVRFNVPTGYYRFRWTPVADQLGNSGTWVEAVFGHIKIQQASTSYSKSLTRSSVISADYGNTINDNTAKLNNEKDEWYTVQGQKLSSAPSVSGIYIHNGKKIVVK